MKDMKKEIVEKYLLPERPFLHGMASAFDLFGVLNQGVDERLFADLQGAFRMRDSDVVSAAWQKVGEALLWALNEEEKAIAEGNSH